MASAVIASSRQAQAQTLNVIHNFTGPEGANPEAGVSIRGGNLFGTTYNGANGGGSVYEVVHVGNNWGTTPIYLFASNAHPLARVVFDTVGHLYGTASGGSTSKGFVFELFPPLSVCKIANCFWTEKLITQFSGPTGDGANPGYGDLVWDAQGKNIYLTTVLGGLDVNNHQGYGTVCELQPSEHCYNGGTILEFAGPTGDGAFPQNGVVFDGTGNNLFGTTQNGGSASGCTGNCGTVFEMSYIPGLGWIEQTPLVYDFQDGSDGSLPVAGLVFDSTHTNLFGATTDGGQGGGGTVFELSPSGNNWTFQLLHSFSGMPGQQCGPWASLTMDAQGNLYGTTRCDGASNQGSIFKLTNSGNMYTYSTLYEFTGGSDGAMPISNVTIDTDGTLYGTTSMGGSLGKGVVWSFKP